MAEAVAAKDEQIKELQEELEETKDKLNEIEQYSRRLCLNITGIPEGGQHESTDQLVTDTAKMTNVAVTPRDIDVSHRVGAFKQGKNRAIIVRFTNFAKRQEVYNARKELRKPHLFPGSTVSAETASNAFIADNLTRVNQFILFKARELRKRNKIFAAWSDVGKLKIRVMRGGPTRVIRSERDLMKLVGQEPAAGAEGQPRVLRSGRSTSTS